MPLMQHILREALVGYLSKTGSWEERATVEWHLANCPVCRQKITARDIALIARDVRKEQMERSNRND